MTVNENNKGRNDATYIFLIKKKKKKKKKD